MPNDEILVKEKDVDTLTKERANSTKTIRSKKVVNSAENEINGSKYGFTATMKQGELHTVYGDGDINLCCSCSGSATGNFDE